MKRSMTADPYCMHCRDMEEDLHHIIRECERAKKLREIARGMERWRRLAYLHFVGWLDNNLTAKQRGLDEAGRADSQ